MAPDVSTATGRRMERGPNIVYLAIFLTSAASATDQAARDRFEDSKVLAHIASQMRQRPHE